MTAFAMLRRIKGSGQLKLAPACALVLLLSASSAFAQRPPAAAGMPADTLPAAIREVGFDQNLGQQLPLEVEFRNEHGAPVRLGEYFGKRPVVLAFVYYGCPMLCLQSLSSLASTLSTSASRSVMAPASTQRSSRHRNSFAGATRRVALTRSLSNSSAVNMT